MYPNESVHTAVKNSEGAYSLVILVSFWPTSPRIRIPKEEKNHSRVPLNNRAKPEGVWCPILMSFNFHLDYL
jgi:hypothetical protein